MKNNITIYQFWGEILKLKFKYQINYSVTVSQNITSFKISNFYLPLLYFIKQIMSWEIHLLKYVQWYITLSKITALLIFKY